jgi:hypothetical protein
MPENFVVNLIRPCTAALFSIAWLLTSSPTTSEAGDDDPRNYFSLPEAVEIDGLRIEFREVWAEADFIKVKAKFTNDSNDYIFFHKHEAEFDGDFGKKKAHDGKKKKPVVLAPKKSKSHTWKVSGEDGFLVDGFELALAGFSRVGTDGDSLETPDFQLPASRNDFEAGPFKCKLTKKVYQETKETRADFSCKYVGDAIGWVDSASLGVALPDGTEFANDEKNAGKKMLKPGDTSGFAAVFHIEYKVTDMQFTTMQIKWRNTFAESKIEALDVEEVEFEFDAALTKEKAE